METNAIYSVLKLSARYRTRTTIIQIVHITPENEADAKIANAATYGKMYMGFTHVGNMATRNGIEAPDIKLNNCHVHRMKLG